jgi:hypothetical protein
MARKFERSGKQIVPAGAAELAAKLEPLLATKDAARRKARGLTAYSFAPRPVSFHVQQLREAYVAFVCEFQRHSADGVGATPPTDLAAHQRHAQLLDGYIAYRDFVRTGDTWPPAATAAGNELEELVRKLKRNRELHSAGYKRFHAWLRQTRGTRAQALLENRVLVTDDPSLLNALNDYREYHRLDMEIRKLLQKEQSRGGGAAGKKRPRTEAELQASLKSSKRGYSTYRTRYERGMTVEDRRRLLLDGDTDEVMKLLAAYED